MRAAFIAGLASVMLAGCNTVAGVGKDISAVGRGVTGAAEYVQASARGDASQRRTKVIGQQTRYLDGRVVTGRPCDPDRLAGGPPTQSGLPACDHAPVYYSRPVSRDRK